VAMIDTVEDGATVEVGIIGHEGMVGINIFLGCRIPLGRPGEVKEIVEPVVFLASDEASYITGAHLYVDGGYTAT
jgi:NAD(P)-dependent dehydrogenase (short-subunit alcohol dehydrogenase family)